MHPRDILKLTLLAAIWGGAFVFIRYLVPIIGPWLTVEFRVLIAGVAIIGFMAWRGVRGDLRQNWKLYAWIGLLNTAIPFSLFGFAAKIMPAGYLSILNASTPAFGALFSFLLLGERFGWRHIAGFVLGIIGVSLVTGTGAQHIDAEGFYWAALACLSAACLYGWSGVLIRKYAGHVPPLALAAYGQLMAGLMILPMSLATWPQFTLTWQLAGLILIFALACSGLAYVLFFQLMGSIGAVKTLTVTYLIPVFGMIWAFVLLGEDITLHMLAGFGIIVLGTTLINRRQT